jgi:hypothetical protein
MSQFPTQLAPDRPNTRVRDYEPSGLRAVTDSSMSDPGIAASIPTGLPLDPAP